MKISILRILLFLTFMPVNGAVEYFGSSDQFVCHCADQCVPSGECSNCEPGWMGPACQYINLAYGEKAYTTTGFRPLKPNLIDNQDSTCSVPGFATRLTCTVQLIMEESKWMNWVQIVVKSNDLKYIQQVRAVIKASPDTYCSLHVSQSGPVYDFLCDQTLYSSQVDFYIDLYTPAPISVCEIRINGGMNVAVKKPATQTTDLAYLGMVYPAELAVDGNTDRRFFESKSCSHTDRCISGSILAWEVDLNSNYNVHIVKIYNRQGYEDRLRGFTLTTRTDKGDVRRLYKDNLPTGPREIITAMSDRELFVRYVTITIPRCQNLALCEVEVFSTTSPCPPTNYGFDCTGICNCRNASESCEKIFGFCTSGCLPGYEGGDCKDACQAGTFGPDCIFTCNCRDPNETCNTTTGSCLSRCPPGYQEPSCQNDCEEGTFGQNCMYNCSEGCKRAKCHRENGVCKDCSAGLKGDNCSIPCDEGFYGENCTSVCNENCEGGRCNNVNGVCLRCTVGFFGGFCSDECPAGRYGSNCENSCSDWCDGGLCNGTDGSCTCGQGWTGQKCDEATGMSTGVIAGIAAACIIILILAVIIALIIVRRRIKSEAVDDSVHFSTGAGSKKVVISKPAAVSTRNESSQSSPIPKVAPLNNTGDEYYNIAATSSSSTVVSTRDFPQFVRNMRTDKNQLCKEFQKLPKGMTHEWDTARRAENVTKNRYKDICAYDHSRVILPVDPEKPELGNYINACYIDTPRKEKSFIAAEGPNTVMINNFIRMLWQLSISRVVMLTNLLEEGKQKCLQYWPDEGKTLEFGDMKVNLKEIESYANYTIRQLCLTRNGKESRQVTQFHYTVWPDKGVPTSGASLIDFREKVIPVGAPAKSPIVVHCSEGVGRTGTFIALQYLKEEAEMSSTQDIYTCVWKLRQQRVNMVQTKDQYVFLHETCLLSLILTSSTYSAGQFVQQYPQLDQEKIEEEFKMIDECAVGNEKENATRTPMVPDSEYGEIGNYVTAVPEPILEPNNEYEVTFGTPMNALFVPSYENAQRYIQTQTPLPSTVVDIWRLVQDHGVSVIVMLDFYSQDQGDVAVYWPELKSPLQIGPYWLECMTVSQGGGLVMHNIQLKQDHRTQKVLHLTAKFWPDDGLPTVSSLLQLVRMATTEKGPIIVHCRNGVDRSGLFCAVSAVIERIKGDNSVAVPLVVSDIKAVWKRNIPNVAQYKLCYEAVAEYLGAGAVYEKPEVHVSAGTDVDTEIEAEHVYSAISY